MHLQSIGIYYYYYYYTLLLHITSYMFRMFWAIIRENQMQKEIYIKQ